MYKKEVENYPVVLNSSLDKEFRFKRFLSTHGSCMHSEFRFKIKSSLSESIKKSISISVVPKTFSSFGDKEKHTFSDYEFKLLLKLPFEKGVEDFVEYLNSQKIGISTNVNIEILEYYFHVVDSKPIANQISILNALKCVFENQLDFSRTKYDELLLI